MSADSLLTITPLAVPQHRNADPVLVVGVGGLVGLGQERKAVDLVGVLSSNAQPRSSRSGLTNETPIASSRPISRAADQRAVRPRAGAGDVQVVAAGRERELRVRRVGHLAAEAAVLALEGAVGGALAAEGERSGLRAHAFEATQRRRVAKGWPQGG